MCVRVGMCVHEQASVRAQRHANVGVGGMCLHVGGISLVCVVLVMGAWVHGVHEVRGCCHSDVHGVCCLCMHVVKLCFYSELHVVYVSWLVDVHVHVCACVGA
jgi:hypothetical protein